MTPNDMSFCVIFTHATDDSLAASRLTHPPNDKVILLVSLIRHSIKMNDHRGSETAQSMNNVKGMHEVVRHQGAQPLVFSSTL